MFGSWSLSEKRASTQFAAAKIESNLLFQGQSGDRLLNVLADTLVMAHESSLGKGVVGSRKWSLVLDWNQSAIGSGLFGLKFGNTYLAAHYRKRGMEVYLHDDAVPYELRKRVRPSGYRQVPDLDTWTVDLEECAYWEALKPAFRAACDAASQIYGDVYSASKKSHSTGLLQYLRDRLERPELPDPAWWEAR
jgi:hypothetical protein